MSMSHLYGRDEEEDGVELERFEVTDWDLQNEFNPERRRHRQTKEEATYGMWAEHDSDDERPSFGGKRSKDYTAPVNFISAGLRKSAAEEREQRQSQPDSDDSDDMDKGKREERPRESGPRKLQTISLPSLEDTLEQLSLINGILCVSASINSEEPTNNSDATAKLEELASNQNKEVELLANETSDTKTDVPALVHQVELNTNEETATEALTNGNADAERAPPLPIQEEFSSDEETVIEDVTSEDRGPEKDMPTSNQEEILSDEKTSPSLVTNGNNPETDT
ncbi:Tuftelin-interacting protein 11 [Acipenser ruthenus]|uniref:Tuftelin-interacting protein 11 n=1 Tax=Acipenser ruthenus TaxID=7906 RepID=A0A444V3C6_ACIRT|nr:Tuftelin-interacting protein 11 [Acipenser ruthenus]